MLAKPALMILITISLFTVTASAQIAAFDEKQAVVKQLVALINENNRAEEMMKAIVSAMQEAQSQTIKTIISEHAELSRDEKQKLETALTEYGKSSSRRFMDALNSKVNYGDTLNEISAVLYDKFYTLAELKDLLAFYQTPTGQKTLKVMTPMSVESIKLSREKLAPKMEEAFKEIMETDRAEMENILKSVKPNP